MSGPRVRAVPSDGECDSGYPALMRLRSRFSQRLFPRQISDQPSPSRRRPPATAGAIQLYNSTARAAATPLPPLPEHELESPNFVPAQLVQFAAAGYVRGNRWA